MNRILSTVMFGPCARPVALGVVCALAGMGSAVPVSMSVADDDGTLW